MNPHTTSAFDLPDHLTAKADPTLIAGDEQHFAAIAESLDQSIADLSDRLDAERRAPGGIGQEAMDRDLEIHRLTARLRVLRRFGLDLCLGRIVRADNPEPVYVGRLGLTDSTLFQGLEPGTHAIALLDLAGNCAVQGADLRSASVTAGTVATVGFEVTCGATAALRVVTTSEGTPADPDGYQLVLPGRGTRPIGANETITIAGLPPGVLTLELTDLAATCTVPDGSTRRATLAARDTAQVRFAVHCAPPPPAYGTIQVFVSTQVINTPTPSGYTITLDGTTSRNVGANDAVSFERLTAGWHSVGLSGAPAYCAVGGFFPGPNPVSVKVTGGSVSTVSFGVLCLP